MRWLKFKSTNGTSVSEEFALANRKSLGVYQTFVQILCYHYLASHLKTQKLNQMPQYNRLGLSQGAKLTSDLCFAFKILGKEIGHG